MYVIKIQFLFLTFRDQFNKLLKEKYKYKQQRERDGFEEDDIIFANKKGFRVAYVPCDRSFKMHFN